MNLRPWDLWTADGKPQPGTPDLLRVLEAVREKSPDHPLASHLLIHALEASPNPGQADDAANRLRGKHPALGHLLHMPSHIDIRRGRWAEAVEANQLAIAADRKYREAVPAQGFYRLYMAHNAHMLAFAAVMQGRSELALKAVRGAIADVPRDWLAVKENAAIADGFVAMPLEVLMRFGRWDDILKEPEPAECFPVARALRHHARGVAFAARGQVAEARTEQGAFRTAAGKVAVEARVGNNTAADVLAVAGHVLEGEIRLRDGKVQDAVAALREAVAREDRLRYAEPPDWFVPARHALGAVLLRDRQAAAAEAVYRDDLRRWPDNGWSLHGLAASLAVQGKRDEAARVRERFDAVWKSADVRIPSSCYCVPE
jgi:tetratricopeptide (TPR) repeat protein